MGLADKFLLLAVRCSDEDTIATPVPTYDLHSNAMINMVYLKWEAIDIHAQQVPICQNTTGVAGVIDKVFPHTDKFVHKL